MSLNRKQPLDGFDVISLIKPEMFTWSFIILFWNPTAKLRKSYDLSNLWCCYGLSDVVMNPEIHWIFE